MSAVRIYQPGDYLAGETIILSPEGSHHVGTVLRMQPGESLILFSGNNEECLALIETVTKKSVTVRLGAIKEVNRESPLAIHLGQAISKGDRMEWVVQKAVELGVASITPVITAHCAVKRDKERLNKKQQQWQSIAIAACEQSGRNVVPIIHDPIDFMGFVQSAQSELRLILHPAGNSTWRDHARGAYQITLLIGPEGGLSDEEVRRAKASGFHPMSLGPRILRTETAAITALGVLQAVAGDL